MRLKFCKINSFKFSTLPSAAITFWKPVALAFASVILPTQKHKIFLSIFLVSKNLTALALVKIIPLKSEKLISL